MKETGMSMGGKFHFGLVEYEMTARLQSVSVK